VSRSLPDLSDLCSLDVLAGSTCRRTVKGMKSTRLRGRIAAAFLVTISLILTSTPALAYQLEETGGSKVNRTGGGSSVGGGADEDTDKSVGRRDNDVPWCSGMERGGFWRDAARTVVDNNYFIAPFPGCKGVKGASLSGTNRSSITSTTTVWTPALKNCFTGYMVWRFYGTLRPNDANRVATVSRVEVPRWCADGKDQNADFFFPNATDATGNLAREVDGTRADFAYKTENYYGRTVVKTSDGVNTTGAAVMVKGNCTKPLTDLPNWLTTSVGANPEAARKKLFERYTDTRRVTNSSETARLDINATAVPRSAEDIRVGSTRDCSSIYDYQGYIKTGKNSPYATAADIPQNVIRDNTVVVGTCAIPLERPARVYTGRNNYAFFGPNVVGGRLGERYSKADFAYGVADDAITAQYKKIVGQTAFTDKIIPGKTPGTPVDWPAAERIAVVGTSAWNTVNVTPRPDLVEKFTRCDYQTLSPQTTLIGDPPTCEELGTCPKEPDCTTSPRGCSSTDITRTLRDKDTGRTSDVYVEVTATLRKYYTASGEMKQFDIPTRSRVLCNGSPCTGRLDPRIISYDYRTELTSSSTFKPCATRGARGCDWFATGAGKNGEVKAVFYSPTAKGELVRFIVAEATVTFARKEEREITRCETVTVTNSVTGEVSSEEFCWTEIIIVELPPETANASVLISKNTTGEFTPSSDRTVTGSVGS
jgi:hypothetical protein